MRNLWILFLCYSFLGYAQERFTLSGYVKDNTSAEALFGVTLQIDATTGTITNDYGFYSITLDKGTYTIAVSYLGFKTKTVTVNLTKNTKLDIVLTEDVNALDEVVVSSSSASKKVNTLEMSTLSLKAETVEKLPAVLGEPDVLKSIQLLPGVSSVSEGSSGFNVRGGSSDQNLILLDEATIYNASHLFGFFSVFNTGAIKNVKLYKAGIPSIYGGRLSSVLDMKQKEGNKKDFNAELGIGLIASKALIEGPLFKGEQEEAKGSYMIAGRRSYVDLFAFMSEDFKDTSLYFYDLNLKANYSFNKNNRLFLSGYFGRDNFGIDDFLGTTWGNASGTLRWTSSLSDKLFLQTSAIYSAYNYNLDNLRSGSELQWKSNITNFNLKPKLSWFINPNNTLTTGVDVVYYNFAPGEIIPLKNSTITAKKFQEKYALELGAYIDMKQTLTDKLSMRYGLRFSSFSRLAPEKVALYQTGTPLSYDPVLDFYTENKRIGEKQYTSGETIKTYNALEPRFSMRYLISDNHSIKASYNRMYQYIHLISNSASATPLDVWAPSGNYIKPQYADQYALGYFTTIKDKAYDFNAEVYYKNLQDVTDFVDGADLLFTENIETELVQGKARAYGLELQVSKNKGNLTGWLSYTLAKSERKIQGINKNNYYPSNTDQLHELSLVGMYTLNDRWSFGSNFVFGSGKPVTYPTGKYHQNGLVVPDYDSRNGNRLPAYHRLDISATLAPKPGKRGKWVFSVANVYNRKNAASIFFREVSERGGKEVATGKTEATKLSFFGIVPSIMYQIKF